MMLHKLLSSSLNYPTVLQNSDGNIKSEMPLYTNDTKRSSLSLYQQMA